jgi:hypothetical protein
LSRPLIDRINSPYAPLPAISGMFASVRSWVTVTHSSNQKYRLTIFGLVHIARYWALSWWFSSPIDGQRCFFSVLSWLHASAQLRIKSRCLLSIVCTISRVKFWRAFSFVSHLASSQSNRLAQVLYVANSVAVKFRISICLSGWGFLNLLTWSSTSLSSSNFFSLSGKRSGLTYSHTLFRSAEIFLMNSHFDQSSDFLRVTNALVTCISCSWVTITSAEYALSVEYCWTGKGSN